MITQLTRQLTILLLITFIYACGGSKTFNDYARAGDTVAVAGGYQPNFNINNISIDITQGVRYNLIYSYPQGDPAIRASVNLYPDPLSGLIVSRETGIVLTPFADIYEDVITANFTNNDKDWYQTTVFVDLPATLPTGTYKVRVKNTLGEVFDSSIEIIDGAGTPSTLTAASGTDLDADMIAGISRLPHHTINLSGAINPYAVEMILTHDPDSTAGGTGKAFAVNPIGYKKNLAWSDDGNTMKVILTPASNASPPNLLDYKFYVTGQITNLAVSSVSAFDINGNSISGITASSVASN